MMKSDNMEIKREQAIVAYEVADENGRKMLEATKNKQKTYKFCVCVEAPGQMRFYEIEAHNADEAMIMAKEKFVSIWWKESLLKASVWYREKSKNVTR